MISKSSLVYSKAQVENMNQGQALICSSRTYEYLFYKHRNILIILTLVMLNKLRRHAHF